MWPGFDKLLRDAGAAQRYVTELEQERNIQADRFSALRQSVEQLTTKLAEAPAKAKKRIYRALRPNGAYSVMANLVTA